MEIRSAERRDSRAIAALWTHAFPGERTAADRVHQLETGGTFGGIEATFVAQSQGRMVGALRAYRMTQYIGASALPMMGLASVAVSPDARRSGIGREMCRQILRLARERGDIVSALYPFRPAFYRSLGWGLVGELHGYRFAPESLSAEAAAIPVRLAVLPTDEPAIAACYERVARMSTGLIARNERVWRQHLDARDTHVFVLDEVRPRGYMLVRYGRARSPDHKPLIVRELIAEDPAAYDALLAWIASQRDQWRRVRYDATPHEHFALRLADPRLSGSRPARALWAPVARIIRGPMLRILDVTAAFERRQSWGPAVPHRVALDVRDPELPENAGPFTIDFDGRSATVTTGRDADVLLRTDAATLAQLYAGEIGVSAAVRLGSAQADGDVSAVDAMLRSDSSFRLLDVF